MISLNRPRPASDAVYRSLFTVHSIGRFPRGFALFRRSYGQRQGSYAHVSANFGTFSAGFTYNVEYPGSGRRFVANCAVAEIAGICRFSGRWKNRGPYTLVIAPKWGFFVSHVHAQPGGIFASVP
ncbi:MAG: hypothetical protein Q7T82_14075 [Armatimonadota bacterium]|nr:hypothetical protein [Armatimonadota bacterium]